MPEFTVYVTVAVPTVKFLARDAEAECVQHVEKALRSQPSLAKIVKAVAYEEKFTPEGDRRP